MYSVSVPVFVNTDAFDPTSILAELRRVGARRVFLAIDFLSHDKHIMEGYYDALARAIPPFREAGLEVGIWFWTFRFFSEEPRHTVMVNALGEECHTTTVKYCPLDEGYLSFMEEHVKRLAALHPDLILFDDDLAFGFTSMKAPSCFCPLHRQKMAEFLDGEVPAVEGLYETMFSGPKNRYRSAFMRALGDSLTHFARRMRAAVDSVAPTVRMGQCGCITTFDYDGVDSFTISRLLAGNTKPFLRLIGAPYWDPVRLHGNYLCDVIELERMERAWESAEDIEIVSEGDTYPRPRHRVPASYLEIFDAALRADGHMNGILKYVLCYANHTHYERGYVDAHVRNEADLKAVEKAFGGLSDAGVRIWESMKKIEDADYSHDTLTPDLIRYQLFSRAVRFLSHNSIPVAHRGFGCAGIVFGENARALPTAALDKPLMLDEHAARILQERGIDVGVAAFGARFTPVQEHFLTTDEYESVTDYGHKPPFASTVTPREGATVESEWILPDGSTRPASFTYRNADGQVFLVFCMDAFTAADEIYKNYSRQHQMLDFLARNGAHLPAAVSGNPDLYVLCKEDEDTLAVGFFNCFADAVDHATVTLDAPYREADFCRVSGSLSGNTLTIDHLSAFDWGFVKVKK